MNAVASTSRLAARLGGNTESLSALQYAAQASGIDIEAFNDGLSDMVEKLGDARMGGGDAGEALASLGLSLDEVSQMDPTQAFTLIADKISKLDSQADKITLADKLFAGVGQEIVPMLDKGAAGIEEMKNRAAELGLTFNDIDSAQIMASKAAMTELSAIVTGITRQLAIKLAPVIAGITQTFVNLGTSGFDAQKLIGTGVKWLVKGIAFGADILNVFKLGFMLLQSAVTFGLGWFIKGWGLTGEAIEKVVNMLPNVEVAFSNTITAIGDDLIKLSENQFDDFTSALDKPLPSAGVEKFFADVENNVTKAAEKAKEKSKEIANAVSPAMHRAGQAAKDLVTKLKEQIATYGMSGTAAEIFKLKQQGASDEIIKEAEKLSKALDMMAEDKKLEDWGKGLEESLLTPLQKFQKELDKLELAKQKGFIDENTFNLAKEKASKELESSKSESGLSGALAFNSAEARSVVLKSRMSGHSPEMKTQKEQLAENKKQTKSLEKIANQPPIIYTFG